MPVLSADNASSVVAEPTITEDRFEAAEISLPSNSVNPDPRVADLFNRGGTATVDLFSTDGLSGPRDGDPVMRGHWSVASEMRHVDETNIADALNAVNKVTSAATTLNTAEEQKKFLNNHYTLQEQTLERALHDLVKSYDQTSPNPNALQDNFDNFRSRYITTFAASPEDVERMEEMFDNLEDALLSQDAATRSAATRTLLDRADTLDLPTGIESALQQDGRGRFDSFIRAMENDVDKAIIQKREHLAAQNTNVEEVFYRELSRTSNNLAADYLTQSNFPLTEEQEQQIVDLLHSGDPSALHSAIAHLRTFNPAAADGMEALQLQQTYLDARFGPAAGRDEALSSLRTQLGEAADFPAPAALELAQQRLPEAVTREVIGSLGQDEDGMRQIANEYAHIPMRERVDKLHRFIEEVQSGRLEGEELIERAIEVYGGLSHEQAHKLGLEYSRMHNTDMPGTLISDRIFSMDYQTRTLVSGIMGGFDAANWAALIEEAKSPTHMNNNIRLFSWFSDEAGITRSDETYALNALMRATTGAQREEVLQALKPVLAGLKGDISTSEWIGGRDGYTPLEWIGDALKNPPIPAPRLRQSLPGFGTTEDNLSLASYQILHLELKKDLDKIDPAKPVTNEDRAAARTAIERKLLNANEEQLALILNDHPEITTVMRDRLIDNPDHDIPGRNPAITTREETLKLIERIANIPDIQSLRTNLTYDAATPEHHNDAIEALNSLRPGSLGQQQLAVINEVLQNDPAGATSLNELTRTYLQAHPSLAQDKRVDLLLASYGMDPNVAVTGLRNPATGSGTLTINDIVQSMNNIPTTLEDRVQAALDREIAERAKNNLKPWEEVEETARRTELTNEIRVAEYTGIEDLQSTNLRELYALRVASLYQTTHGESITTQFPVEDTQRSVMYQQFFGTELGSNILNSGNRVTSVLTQYSPGNDLDDSLHRSLWQARAVAYDYGADAPGGTADPSAPGYANQPTNGSQLMAQMQRDLFIQEFRNHISYANGGTSLHDLMQTTIQSDWWPSKAPVTLRTLGVDFSDLQRTEPQLGNEIDKKLTAVKLDPSEIVTQIHEGKYSLNQFNQDREKITDIGLRQQFAFRVAEHYRRSYDLISPDKRTGKTGIVELEKITLPNNTEHHRQALVSSFYGEAYATNFQELRDEYQQLLQNDATTPEQYRNFFEKVPDVTLFRRNYDYVTGNNLREELTNELTTQEKSTFNSLYRPHLVRIGGAL